jgi:hypothetical protein
LEKVGKHPQTTQYQNIKNDTKERNFLKRKKERKEERKKEKVSEKNPKRG